MNKMLAAVLAACVGLSLSACRGDAPVDPDEIAADEVPEQGPPAAAPASTKLPEASAQSATPVTVGSDAVAVGNAVDPEGRVTASTTTYSVEDIVYVSLPVNRRTPGSQVSVYWTYQDGSSHKEERKRIEAGEKYVNFDISKADGLRPGKYTVQVDVDDVPAGIVDFSVR